jgi:predicted amidohydrolase
MAEATSNLTIDQQRIYNSAGIVGSHVTIYADTTSGSVYLDSAKIEDETIRKGAIDPVISTRRR